MAIKTVELQNPNSCLNKAAPDEFIFVLRANDPAAPNTIEHWAALYALSKGGVSHMSTAQYTKYKEALKCANDMRIAAHLKGEQARYSDDAQAPLP